MKINDYLNTLKENQQVTVYLETKENGKKEHSMLAYHYAGFLKKSTKAGWVRLEVISKKQAPDGIIIIVEDKEK